MLQMNQHYEPEFKKNIVRLHLEEGRSLKGLAAEYGVSKASISNWTKQFREECQKNEEAQADYDFMKENLKLKRQLAEYYGAAEPPVRCGESHLSGLTEPPPLRLISYFAIDGSSPYTSLIERSLAGSTLSISIL